MRLNQLCTRKVRDFVMALRVRNVSGALEKRLPGKLKQKINIYIRESANQYAIFPTLFKLRPKI